MNKETFELAIKEPIGTQLKEVRKYRNVSLVQLATVMGTDAPHLSRIERNNPAYQPTLPTIVSYLQALGVREINIKI